MEKIAARYQIIQELIQAGIVNKQQALNLLRQATFEPDGELPLKELKKKHLIKQLINEDSDE